MRLAALALLLVGCEGTLPVLPQGGPFVLGLGLDATDAQIDAWALAAEMWEPCGAPRITVEIAPAAPNRVYYTLLRPEADADAQQLGVTGDYAEGGTIRVWVGAEPMSKNQRVGLYAHELGHLLGIGHIDSPAKGPRNAMSDPAGYAVTDADIAACKVIYNRP